MLIPLIAAALAGAAPPASPVLVKYAALALDPDGRRIATIDSPQPEGAPTPGHGTIVVRDTAGRPIARFDPCPACRYDGLAWSPDGRSLALVASEGGTATLYVITGGQVRRLTALEGVADTPRWSPDGGRIAFLATQNASKQTGAIEAGARQVGEIGVRTDSRRIAIVPTGGGDIAFASPEGTFVYEFDWMPDGRGFVATAAEGDGDDQWWIASLRAFPIGGRMRVIAAPKMQMRFPRVSPDGSRVAFIGGLMSDFIAPGGDVYSVPVSGGAPQDVTPGARATFTSLAWRGPRLIAGVTKGGETGTAQIDPARRQVSAPIIAPETIEAGDGDVALDRSGTEAAYVTQSFTRAPAIAFGPLGHGRPISHDNDALAASLTARDIRWRNGGSEVQGWLLAPGGAPAADGARQQPMVTIVHGGPASASTPRFAWGGMEAALIRHGYWLFEPNPRGSFGQGEAFVRANVGDFGGGDLDDILTGIDAVEKQAPIDDRRLGLYGHSYGGFMAMWTVTHSQRFKAAVAGAGISDWMAYYGQNGIDQWMIPYFGASAYDDPKPYDRMSPIRSIRNAHTPTLIYVGERDVECPPAQSLEFWHGLRAMGVPTTLVIYADEGHAIREPAHLADRKQRILGWFDRWLGSPDGGAAPAQ